MFQINAAQPGSGASPRTRRPSSISCRTRPPRPAMPTPTSSTPPTAATGASPAASPTASRPRRPDCWPQDSGPSPAGGLAALGTPAWKSLPSWAVVGTEDHVIPPAEQLFMAKRAGAHVVEVAAGHLSLITRADTVADTIITVARSAGCRPGRSKGSGSPPRWRPLTRTRSVEAQIGEPLPGRGGSSSESGPSALVTRIEAISRPARGRRARSPSVCALPPGSPVLGRGVDTGRDDHGTHVGEERTQCVIQDRASGGECLPSPRSGPVCP